ncbi:hypothetical protein [Cytobacillus oceanisediminis]|uniref:hypothetical protein n=1 Tax=Cytobacillus oceanisediminis TaxID=665099 RepID=UPI001FB55B0E|nr:hypothetical protein [Cytobacillus oceanisediminis]UOE58061.1 hypothetical protein IRB79_27750 [Cytobacillus oceanisediminis]
MPQPIATGLISILDFNDAPSLTAFVTTTSPKTQIYDPATTSYTPNWATANPTLTPSLFVSTSGNTDKIAEATVTWYDAAAPSTPLVTDTNYTVTGKNLTVVKNLLTGSAYSKTYIASIVWTDPATGYPLTIKAEFTFNRANNGATGATGAPAITAVLSNESDVIPTDSAGNNGNFTGANTTMYIYEGATDVSSSWTVTAGTPVGLTGSLSGKTYTVTAMSADTAYVDLTASKSGYASITKRFALSKSKTGVAGTTPTLYRLITSASAIQKNISNVYTPTSITVSAKSQTGTGAYGDYSGKFQIWETTDGTNWGTAKYTSSTAEASKAWTPSAGIKALKVQLYLSSVATPNGTGFLDEQIVPIVSDGATGQDAVLVSVWAPSGNLFKNATDTTSLTAQADLYKGGTIQTSNVTYEWFVQKSGNADEGAGLGWDKIDAANQASYGVSGAVNTNTLTIAASGITNLAAFKVKATLSGQTAKYDTIIFYDQTDPIMVVVESSNGNIFKNGNISSQLLCRLYQNGEEIDLKQAAATGTGYKHTYTWTKYKMDGTQDTSFGTSGSKVGKWIDITADDVVQKATFRVEIS